MTKSWLTEVRAYRVGQADQLTRGVAARKRHLDVEPLLTPAEVAELFKVNPLTVTRWANQGRIGSVRTLGGHTRYKEAEVLRLLHKGTQEAEPPADFH
jgi:excisionase family DNA binding protein